MSTELNVGLFVVGAAALLGSAWALTWDGVRPGESAYPLVAHVHTADGLWEGTPVRLSGVEIGSVSHIGLDGHQAALDLQIRAAYTIPVDSALLLRSTGMLGDRFVEIVPGRAEAVLEPGARIVQETPAFDMDAAGRQVQALATDAGASVEAVRSMLTDETNRHHLETTLARLAELTSALAESWQRNDAAVDAILERAAHATARADELATRSAPEIEAQLQALTKAMEKLDAVLTNLESITARIDRGEGTIGGLVNDSEVLDELTSTLRSANAATTSVRELEADAWMTGRLQTGPDGVGTGGTVGGRLDWGPWWVETELVAPASSGRMPMRGTLQLHRQLGPTSWHLGLKEGSEGVGGALHVLNDRLRFQADLFDWLGRDGDPGNLRLGVRVSPVEHLWVEAAADQRLVAPTEQPPVGWLGLGVHVHRSRGRP